MTLSEAARELGVRRFVLEARMVALGWLTQPYLGMCGTCCHAAIAGGFLMPVVEERHSNGMPINVEVGFQITAKGMEVLRNYGAAR